MLHLIPHIMLGITKITGRRNGVMLPGLLNFESMEKNGPRCVLRMMRRKLPQSVCQVTRPEIHHKLAQIQRVG
eukprot:1160570-Pelagomonas_calceolata.AAC.6